MPYDTVPPAVFLQHGDFIVYHLYKNDLFQSGPKTYWFTLQQWGSDEDPHGENGCFDVRCLPQKVADYTDTEDNIKARIIAAIDAGYFAGWEHDEPEPVAGYTVIFRELVEYEVYFNTDQPITAPLAELNGTDPKAWFRAMNDDEATLGWETKHSVLDRTVISLEREPETT